MVMRNRNDGPDARRGRDDFPPRLGTRVSHPPAPEPEKEVEERAAEPAAPLVTAGELVRDLARLALLFSVIAVANMLFLLLAMSFLASR